MYLIKFIDLYFFSFFVSFYFIMIVDFICLLFIVLFQWGVVQVKRNKKHIIIAHALKRFKSKKIIYVDGWLNTTLSVRIYTELIIKPTYNLTTGKSFPVFNLIYIYWHNPKYTMNTTGTK